VDWKGGEVFFETAKEEETNEGEGWKNGADQDGVGLTAEEEDGTDGDNAQVESNHANPKRGIELMTGASALASLLLFLF